MATNYFSSWYSSGAAGTDPGDAQTVLADPHRAIPAGVLHARSRLNICFADLDAVTLAEADTVRFCTMKSSDRIVSIRVSTDGVFTDTTDMDLGIYDVGDDEAHDGALVDKDLFGASFDLGGSGAAPTDVLTNGIIGFTDPGRMQLFQMAELGSYSAPDAAVDPLISWDIVGTIDTVSTAEGEILVIVEYTAGA